MPFSTTLKSDIKGSTMEKAILCRLILIFGFCHQTYFFKLGTTLDDIKSFANPKYVNISVKITYWTRNHYNYLANFDMNFVRDISDVFVCFYIFFIFFYRKDKFDMNFLVSVLPKSILSLEK